MPEENYTVKKLREFKAFGVRCCWYQYGGSVRVKYKELVLV
jgi:hypothetical protein